MYSGPVATFADQDTTDDVSSYTVRISWGDGTSSSGFVAGGGGSYTASGSHIYQNSGRYSVVVTIADSGGSQTQATTTLVV